MPFGEVKLIPGVNVERTPTLLEASISRSQLVRFKDGLVQKYGGWQLYFSSTSGVPRDFHAWKDLSGTLHLLVGTTTQLGIITSGSLADITPQQLTNNPAVNFSTTSGTNVVTIVDAGIATVTTFDAITLQTPVSIGGLILFGVYQITLVTGATSYQIKAASNATSTVNNGGAVPQFTTTINSSTVTVTLTAHALAVGNTFYLNTSTTGNGVTLSANYTVVTVPTADTFTIVASSQATSSGSFFQNSAAARIVYNITIGPAPPGSGYGLGGYGLGGYGTGATTSGQTGTPITATDYTSDNWGQIVLACPSGGGVYQYDPTGGFTSASLIPTAPPLNGGIFISNALQILFCWGSTQTNAIGLSLDPMLIAWSNQGDFTNFVTSTTTQAGNFRIPIGSVIRGGMAVANQNLFWTDQDLWAANYAGFPLVFGFNKIGSGAGAISSHAMQQLRNGVFWMGISNFYSYSSGGVAVIPCPVWDFVFQNMNTTFSSNVRAMPNTGFNEVGWLFPSSAATNGECDSYVKFNITEPNAPWDYGSLQRSAWIDQSILGMPIAATSSGVIFQHETTNNAAGAPLISSFTTGYFYIGEGQEFAFVDQVIPDMIWGTFGSGSSATVFISFSVLDYPGDTPTVYGPYTMTSATQYIPVRFRGRQMSVTLLSADTDSFWRLGKIRYRYAPAGRR